MSAEGKKKFARMPQAFGMQWQSRNSFRLGDYDFAIPGSLSDLVMAGRDDIGDKFYLGKYAEIIALYCNLFKNKEFKRIVELGVFKGGSAAFLQLLAQPERVLAVELCPEPIEKLERFIKSEGLEDSFRLECGVNQADTVLLRELAIEHFGIEPSIDLVIDDASHMLGPTRASFETLFPLLVPGGAYIIEDFASLPLIFYEWLDVIDSAEEQQAEQIRTMITGSVKTCIESDHQPLHILATECMLASITNPGIVNRVIVDRHWLKIIRGRKVIEYPEAFDLRALANDHFGLLKATPSKDIQRFMI